MEVQIAAIKSEAKRQMKKQNKLNAEILIYTWIYYVSI